MQSDLFSDAALVVLGHGTTLNDQSAVPVLQHAAELRRRRIFAEVREAFWKQEPHIKKVLAELTAPRIFIVPLFISEGYFSTEIIPKELGFAFPDNLKLKTKNSELNYCRPVGSHASMTRVILARAEEVMRKFPFPRAPKPADTTLLIAGHGTERNANSRKAVERQVELDPRTQYLCGGGGGVHGGSTVHQRLPAIRANEKYRGRPVFHQRRIACRRGHPGPAG